jgi:hypothetical protein
MASAHAARRLIDMADAGTVIAIELLAAAQGRTPPPAASRPPPKRCAPAPPRGAASSTRPRPHPDQQAAIVIRSGAVIEAAGLDRLPALCA